jgi:hypothetical protein
MEKGYRVMVDDNFEYMDEDARWELGEYATFEEAVAASKKMVEDFFSDAEPGQTAKQLYDGYVMFGDDPWIIEFGGAEQAAKRFSAWDYAKEHAKRLGQKTKPKKEKKS